MKNPFAGYGLSLNKPFLLSDGGDYIYMCKEFEAMNARNPAVKRRYSFLMVRVTLALVDPEASRLLAAANLNEKFLRLFETSRPAAGSMNNTKAS